MGIFFTHSDSERRHTKHVWTKSLQHNEMYEHKTNNTMTWLNNIGAHTKQLSLQQLRMTFKFAWIPLAFHSVKESGVLERAGRTEVIPKPEVRRVSALLKKLEVHPQFSNIIKRGHTCTFSEVNRRVSDVVYTSMSCLISVLFISVKNLAASKRQVPAVCCVVLCCVCYNIIMGVVNVLASPLSSPPYIPTTPLPLPPATCHTHNSHFTCYNLSVGFVDLSLHTKGK